MERKSTFSNNFLQKKLLFSFMILGLFISQYSTAHDVTGYNYSCATGPVYKVDATVANVNSGSNYAWQYKNTSGNWVCIVNGTNTIRGNSYSVSGATSTATTNPAPLVFNNPNSALQGLVIRCVISDGTGVNPCNMPSGNTYNSGTNSVNHTVAINNTPCAPASVMQLGNRVWYDVNNNGINTNEDGISGVTVHLYKDDNNDDNADGAFIATDITDADGYYSFSNLAPGNYIVGVVTPDGYMSSSINGGDPDNNINFDDNGQVTVGNETRGLAITLSIGNEPDGNSNTTNNNITYDFGFLPDCACTSSQNNLLINGSFENGTTGWSAANGTFTTGTGYVACGAKNGFNDWTTGTSIVYQDVTVVPGATIAFKGFAGTHTPGIACAPKLSLVFYNGSTKLSQSDVTVDQDVDVNHSQLAQYVITAVAPATTTKVRVQSSITCNVMKLDAFCLTTSCTTPATPIATITQPTCALATGTVVLSNLPSGSWTINGTNDGVPFTLTGSGTSYTSNNVDPGTFVLTVTNAGGCTSAPVTIVVNNQPATPSTPTATVTQPTCSVATGSVVLSGLPAGNWVVTKNPGNTTFTGTGTSVTINSLATGTYTFTVTNASGCTSSAANAIVNAQPATPTAPAYTVTHPTCTVSSGSVALSGLPATGTWTLTRKINGVTTTTTGTGTTATISGLAAGTYTFTVTNASGCTSPATGNVVINAQPALPVAPTATVTQSICSASTGTILLSGLPSTGSWTLIRNPGNVTTTGSGTSTAVNGLAVGTYTFTVTNSNGCVSPVTSVTIGSQTANASLGGFVWIDVNKNGFDDDGSLALSGVLVSLYNDANADNIADGVALKTFTTTTTGRYSFTSLCPGNYIIGFGAANGYVRTIQLNLLNNDASDSDPNQVTGLTRSINLVAGQADYTNDAGYYSSTILPVSFGSITAQARNCEVALVFEVLTQKNTRQFEIQYSKDGGTSWANVGVLSAKSSNATAYKYSFTHTQPAIGINLYRIKGVDADSKVTYSEIVSATSSCAGKGQITTYPNPAFDLLNVSLPSTYQDAQVQLFNGMGQLVVADVRKSGLIRTLNTQNLTPGIYLLKVVYNNTVVLTQKVVKGE